MFQTINNDDMKVNRFSYLHDIRRKQIEYRTKQEIGIFWVNRNVGNEFS